MSDITKPVVMPDAGHLLTAAAILAAAITEQRQ
jgi:hypothetical protein